MDNEQLPPEFGAPGGNGVTDGWTGGLNNPDEIRARPSILPNASAFVGQGGFFRLKVRRRQEDGQVVDLGYLPADADEAALLAKWPQPARYEIQLVNEDGVELLNQGGMSKPKVLLIPPDHELLRTAARFAASTGTAMSALSPEVLRLIADERRRSDDLLTRERERLDAERRELGNEKQRLSDQKLALAVEATTNQHEHHTRLLDDFTKRDDHARSTLTSSFESMIASQDAAHRRQMEIEKAARDAERERNKQEIEARKLDWEQEKARIREDRDARERKEREEREDRQKREKDERDERAKRDREEREARDQREKERTERDRAHQEAMMKLITERANASNPIATMTTLVTTLAPLAKLVGVDLKDIGGALGGLVGSSGPKGIVEVIGDTVRAVAEAQVEIQKARLKALSEGIDPDDEEGEMMPPEEAMMAPPQQVGGPVRGQQPMAPQGGQQPGQPVPGNQPAEPPEAAALRGLPPKTVKLARQAIREAVVHLQGAPPDQRALVIGSLMASHPNKQEVETFLRATSIRFALQDGGASDLLTSEACAQVDAMNVVPQGIRIR